ncbi:MAG: insulinase family protein [Bacilli bacterium]|nr:insulinase family protein [Bacilli bacterium]
MNKNYTVIKEEFIEEIHSKATLLKHNKSGARLVLLANDDENKVFQVGFRTPPTDDTGVPHILEHSTLCGSKKFPVKDPFVELLKSSLNTFLNALTFADKTLYPTASCNDKDFANLMEVYMDAVFYPNVYLHEEIFKQEGWHYELADKDSPIIYNGVVYNEMKGAFSSPEQVVARASMHALFPDTTYGVESGGDPEFIPDLTYENFKNFHSKYYHPSNSYICLYGNMNMEEKIDWLDKEYLSKFDKIEPHSEIAYQKPFDKPRYEQIYYPVGKDESLDDKTYYSYNVLIGENGDTKLANAFSILNYALLDMPGAPLKQALLDSGICKDVMSSYDSGILQPVISIEVKDAKDGKVEEFARIINETLRKIVKEGIDKKALLAAINYYDFKIREADFGGAPKGLFYAIGMLETWLYDDNDPFNRLLTNKVFDELRNDANGNYFEGIIEKYLLNNNHIAYVTCSPSNTLGEEREKAVAEKLANYKASLSDEQIEKLINDTKALKEYQGSPSSPEDLAKLPRLTINDIKKDLDEVKNDCVEIDGTKLVRHDLFTNGINYITFMFDFSKVSNDLLPYVGLLTSVLGSVSTEHYNYSELSNEILINTGGINFAAQAYANADDALPYLNIDVRVLESKTEFAFDMVKEIIKTSKFDDKKRLYEIVAKDKSRGQMMLAASGMGAGIGRALSYYKKSAKYNELISGIDQYKFIEDLEANFEERFSEFKENLEKLAKIIFRKENLIYSYTNPNRIEEKLVKDFNNCLYSGECEAGSFEFVPEFKNEGFKSSSTVQFACLAGSYANISKYNPVLRVLGTALKYDYLWTQVRVLGGAYGFTCNFTREGDIMLGSYRDPKLAETYEVFKRIPEYIDSLSGDITGYIIGTFGDIDAPLPPKRKGDVAMIAYLTNVDSKQIIEERNKMINCTIDDIKALKPLFEEILKTSGICTIGNENKIEENKELFKVTKNLFK